MYLKQFRHIFTAAFLSLFVLILTAEAQANGALVNKVAGKTIYLKIPAGGTLPVRYNKNGTMSGRAKTMLASYLGKSRDYGRWWVSGAKLCHRWRNWLEGKSVCFTFKQVGRTVYWRTNQGYSGTARISR